MTTFADYKAAQRVYRRHRRDAHARFLMWMYGLPILTLLSALAMWHESHYSDPSSFGLAAWLTFCAAGGTVVIVVLRPWNLRRCYRKMRKSSGLDEATPIGISFDDTVVISAIKDRSEGRFFWNAIQDFAEDPRVALLFIANKRFLFIPKRALNEQQWEVLRQIVREKGIGRAC